MKQNMDENTRAILKQLLTLQETIDFNFEIQRRESKGLADLEIKLNKAVVDIEARMKKLEDEFQFIRERLNHHNDTVRDVVHSTIEKSVKSNTDEMKKKINRLVATKRTTLFVLPEKITFWKKLWRKKG